MFLTVRFADCGWSPRWYPGASPLLPSGASEKRSSSSSAFLKLSLGSFRALWLLLFFGRPPLLLLPLPLLPGLSEDSTILFVCCGALKTFADELSRE
ncbi:hypothetical protein NPIL_190681 [Nephila pilipes]|uniref:Uncharacterized protein n=1 Tax=Nephila pilipes TaxID=299642 RepID=A0A8X6R1B3_NEPPI|nr:hypothetical protein NPIL_190681 [Nephila pilipes]